MDWTVKTRIEMDFFNGNTSGAFGSFPLRLRFAWVDFGPFLIGQAASLFMDYDVFPNVLDYEGPPGMVLVRQPIAAVRLYESDRFKMIVGVEQPYSDIQWFDGAGLVVNPGTGIITTPGVARNVQDLPDFTGNVRWNGDYGHTQVAGIARQLTYPARGRTPKRPSSATASTSPAPGTLGPTCHGCPMCDDCKTPMEKSRFLYQYAAGEGINRYIQDVNGLGLDATFDPVNGFQTISSNGWFMAYEQWWADNWISVFSYGETHSTLTDTLPDQHVPGGDLCVGQPHLACPSNAWALGWNTSTALGKQGWSERNRRSRFRWVFSTSSKSAEPASWGRRTDRSATSDKSPPVHCGHPSAQGRTRGSEVFPRNDSCWGSRSSIPGGSCCRRRRPGSLPSADLPFSLAGSTSTLRFLGNAGR